MKAQLLHFLKFRAGSPSLCQFGERKKPHRMILNSGDDQNSPKTSELKSESMQKSTKIAYSWQGSKNQNRSSFADW